MLRFVSLSRKQNICIGHKLCIRSCSTKVAFFFCHADKYVVRHVWDVCSNARTYTYLLAYLLTPWGRVLLEKLTGFQLVKKFPAFYGIRRFITPFTSASHLSLSWAVWTFRNKIRFYGESLLAPRPTTKLENHPLSAVRDCLFNIFAATLLIGGRSSIRKLRTRRTVVTGTHLSHTRALIHLTPFYTNRADDYWSWVPISADEQDSAEYYHSPWLIICIHELETFRATRQQTRVHLRLNES